MGGTELICTTMMALIILGGMFEMWMNHERPPCDKDKPTSGDEQSTNKE